jgi:uncharacterized membrane protein
MQIQIELTKEIIELLPPEEIKRILIKIISSNGISTPSTIKVAETAPKQVNKDISEADTNFALQEVIPNENHKKFFVAPLEFNDLNKNELTNELFEVLKSKYINNNDSLPNLCREYKVNYSIVYGRLYRQNLIKKKV